MKKLNITDFQPIQLDKSQWMYLAYRDDKIEICLEPCMSGFCVGIYDVKSPNVVILPKRCTAEPTVLSSRLQQAVEYANELLEEYYGAKNATSTK